MIDWQTDSSSTYRMHQYHRINAMEQALSVPAHKVLIEGDVLPERMIQPCYEALDSFFPERYVGDRPVVIEIIGTPESGKTTMTKVLKYSLQGRLLPEITLGSDFTPDNILLQAEEKLNAFENMLKTGISPDTPIILERFLNDSTALLHGLGLDMKDAEMKKIDLLHKTLRQTAVPDAVIVMTSSVSVAMDRRRMKGVPQQSETVNIDVWPKWIESYNWWLVNFYYEFLSPEVGVLVVNPNLFSPEQINVVFAYAKGVQEIARMLPGEERSKRVHELNWEVFGLNSQEVS